MTNRTPALENQLGWRKLAGRRRAELPSAGLRVNEESGRALDLVIDGVMVGTTPWEGSLSVGSHSVALRGAGALGTQPALVPVRASELTPDRRKLIMDLVARVYREQQAEQEGGPNR